MCVSVSVCYLVIFENAWFRFLLNSLLETRVLLINNCGDFLKNFLVAEKSLCKALLIDCHLEISSLLLISVEKHCNAKFFIFEALFFWALSIVITSCSSAICGVLPINSQVQV